MNKLIGILILVLFSSACTQLTEEESNLSGKWEARWVAGSNIVKDLPDHITHSMNGEIIFNVDHSATISGYGFPGCLFAEDTISNELTWELQSQMIKLYNDLDSVTLEYEIIFLEKDTASLIFLDDFNILLRKK